MTNAQHYAERTTLCRIEESPEEEKALRVGSGLFAIRLNN